MPRIVRADPSRVDDAQPLWLALREHHESITDDFGPVRSAEESWGIRRRHYAEILDEGGAMFFAEDDDGRVVGMAVCEQEEGGGSPTWAWPKDVLAVVDVVVLPEARGTGVGEALMEAVEQEARDRGVAALDLMVAGPNAAARRFYAKLGFREDLLTLRKPL